MRERFAVLTIANGVSASMMIAALSLLAVEAIGPVHALVLAAAILYGQWRGKPSPRPIVWDAMAVTALLFFPLDLLLVSRSLIGAALRLLTFVVIYRCSNLSGRRELRQAVSLSFVQILAAAASTTEAYFSLLLAAYLSMAIWTLMAMASSRDDAPPAARRPPAGRPVLAMTAATLAVGGVLFFLLPHFGTGYLRRGSALRADGDGLTGFSDRIELGTINRIKKNRAIVMRARVRSTAGVEPSSLPLRWRGLALDTFDGRSWSAATAGVAWMPFDRDGSFPVGAPIPEGREELEQEISMEPSLMALLPVAPAPSRIASEDLTTVGVDAGGSIHLQAPRGRRFSYHVVSVDPYAALAGFGLSGEADVGEMGRYLTLPRVDPRVEAMARRVTVRATSGFEMARRIEDYLKTSYTYTLEVDDAGVADPVAHFLLERNPGHCEYFATSMAVMLRHLGMPSRVINGFTSGEWSGLAGAFIVRHSDAHSWVEAWLPERGWVTFDPTPADPGAASAAGPLARLRRALIRAELIWDTWVIGLDLLDQESLALSLIDTVKGAARAARDSLVSLLGAAGLLASETAEAAPLAGAALLLLLAALAAGRVDRVRRLLARLFGGREGRRAGPPAADLFRRFEAAWAARGVRRGPGQTPLEFARELEARSLQPPGSALAFVRSYYRARYGT